jgi:hypothetical protein
VVTLRIVRIVTVRTVETRSGMLTGAPLQMRIPADGVTPKTIFIGWISNLRSPFGLFVKTPSPMTTLAVGVVGGDSLMSLNVVVALHTFGRSDSLGS